MNLCCGSKACVVICECCNKGTCLSCIAQVGIGKNWKNNGNNSSSDESSLWSSKVSLISTNTEIGVREIEEGEDKVKEEIDEKLDFNNLDAKSIDSPITIRLHNDGESDFEHVKVVKNEQEISLDVQSTVEASSVIETDECSVEICQKKIYEEPVELENLKESPETEEKNVQSPKHHQEIESESHIIIFRTSLDEDDEAINDTELEEIDNFFLKPPIKMTSSSNKKLCRTCSKSGSHLKPVTKVEKKLKITIKTSLSMITGIDCSEDDVICQKCLKQLIKCSQFIEQCEESDAKWNEQTSSSGYETLEISLENDDTKIESISNDNEPSEIDEISSVNGLIDEEIVDESITPEISKASDEPQVIKMVKFDDPLEEVYESDFEDCTSYDDEPALDVDQTPRKRKNTRRIRQKSKKLDQDDTDFHFCMVCSKYFHY